LQYEYYLQFENLIKTLLNNFSFNITDEKAIEPDPLRYQPDILARKNNLTILLEVKFYRSKQVDLSLLEAAAARLLRYAPNNLTKHVLVVSNYISNKFKEHFLNVFNIIVWDRSNIVNFFKSIGGDQHLESFRQLLTNTQQGTNTENPFDDIEPTEKIPEKYFSFNSSSSFKELKIATQGSFLVKKLNNIPRGKKGWSAFESTSETILKYLFGSNLAVWQKQKRTDDELSRFDMICRIVPQDDFWKTIVNSFNSRYILFEYKNYSTSLPQSQIYSTERYLFPKALRSVAFILCRITPSSHAITAAKGALREHGKLILLLDDTDIKTMLENRDQGISPNDYLSDKLDEFLMSLSR